MLNAENALRCAAVATVHMAVHFAGAEPAQYDRHVEEHIA